MNETSGWKVGDKPFVTTGKGTRSYGWLQCGDTTIVGIVARTGKIRLANGMTFDAKGHRGDPVHGFNLERTFSK